MSDYEASRRANIARNKQLLQSLGLDTPFFEPKEKPYQRRVASPKKRKAVGVVDNGDDNPKVQRIDTDGATTLTLRRSQRIGGKTINYAAERIDYDPIPVAVKSGIRGIDNEGPLGRPAGSKRIHDPYDKFPLLSSLFIQRLSVNNSAQSLGSRWALGGRRGMTY